MSEVEKAFDDVWRTAPEGGLSPRKSLESFTPAVDLHESKDFYLISMDLPGVPEKNIKVDVNQGRLTVSGERSREEKHDEGMFRRFEREYGRFERSFQLPQDVNHENIQARYENGVLEILVPKAEVAKPRAISINKEKGGLFSRLMGQKSVEPTSSEGQAPLPEKH